MKKLEDELTICIPTLNCANTLASVLDCLRYQGMERPKIIISDNGSKDGTLEMLRAMIKNKWFPFDIKIQQFLERIGGMILNVPHMRFRLSEALKTPFVFWLDSDVLLTPYALPTLVKEMKKRKNLGMLGIRYEPLANHVKMGAVLMKSEVAKEVKWRIDKLCECTNCCNQLTLKGLKTEYHKTLQARHLNVT